MNANTRNMPSPVGMHDLVYSHLRFSLMIFSPVGNNIVGVVKLMLCRRESERVKREHFAFRPLSLLGPRGVHRHCVTW